MFVVAVPKLKPMVGYARTATFRAAQPNPRPPAEAQARRGDYYAYIAASPGPTVTVIQDLDPAPGYGAFWGEVNSAVHWGLGCLGCITNGSFRDVDDLAPGFQILGGKIGPSHAFGHIVATGQPVEVHGLRVEHNDLIHADQHGAVVIPTAAAAELPAAIDLVIRREAPILAAARADDFNIEKWLQATKDAMEIH